MCGTPLPQRPISSPGAQSTLNLTRVPAEGPQTTSALSGQFSSVTPTALEEAPAKRVNVPNSREPDSPRTAAPQPSGTAATSNYFSQAEESESLDQFIAKFHYTPPADEDEVTMMGDKPVLDNTARYDQAAPASVAEEQPLVVDPPVESVGAFARPEAAVEQAPPVDTEVVDNEVMEPPPFARKGIRERVPERSGFLDLSEPATQDVASDRGSSIVGPSFLGLSDTPGDAAYVGDEVVAGRSHWRLWTAVIFIGLFAVLGLMEWRSEKAQSNNGPIGVMKMQIERLKGRKGAVITPPPSSEASDAVTPSSSVKPNSSGPEIQVVPPAKPQSTTPEPEPNAPAEKSANPGGASNTPATAPAQSQTAAKSGSASGPAATTAPNTQAEPKNPQPAGGTSAGNEATKSSPAATAPTAAVPAAKPVKPAPGAEELAKAGNASDAAAASAWLWKSVAKGNPEAPVRLANMYIKGDGVPQSCEQALVLLQSASAGQNAAARSRLGALYATGTCVQRNRVRAYEYMRKAVEANPNAAWARDFKQQLWEQMSPQERAQAQTNR